MLKVNQTITPVTPLTLKDDGKYYLSSDFNETVSKEVVTWILESNLQINKPKELTLIITSYGGLVTSAFSIIDVMRSSKIPVHTVGLGIVSSCGLLTFMAGQKGKRILTENTSILSHQYSWARNS